MVWWICLYLRGELMTKPTIKIVNAETGEEIEREMNSAELEQYEKDQKEQLAEEEAKASKAAEKQALLDQLGITAEQAKLLLS
jgi:hypothetical protein